MDTTTQPNQAGVQSPGVEPGSEAAFQTLVDQGLFNDDAPQYRDPGNEERWSASDPKEPPQTQQPPEAAEQKPTEQPKEGEQAPEAPTEREFASLDEYLKDAKLEPESFMQLPVTVKVDGKEQQVPLAELQKSYQLSSAAYGRMNELAHQKTSFEAEVAQKRAATEQLIQGATSLLKFAEQQLMQDFQGINWQQLEAENPGQAALLFQRFQARQGAISQHLNQIEATRQQEAQKAAQERQASLPAEWAKLISVYPEMADVTKGQQARARISAYAQQAGIAPQDIATLLSPQGFNAGYVRVLLDAAAWADLKAKTPATVNRVRTAPQMGKPGTRQVRDPNQVARQQADEAWARSGFRDDEAGARVFEAFVQ